jgi:2-polyprenyl-3-methyl-5-hydroxy-6-metoxy-1,4-benzoquinol methylase
MTDSLNAAKALTAEWDELYARLAAQIPDGEPNPTLVTEVSGLQPGRALDIGCGVGSDAIWLASQGWKVTALDVSQVALDRAAARARQAAVQVEWIHARLEDAQLPAGGFDLVNAHYPALRHSPMHDAAKALLATVAPGGTLLVVHHADVDVEKAKSYGFDPADYLSHSDVAELFDEDWDVQIERRRLRERPTGVELQHTHDDVMKARRLR